MFRPLECRPSLRGRRKSTAAFNTGLQAKYRYESLLVLGIDARDHLEVLLEQRSPQLRAKALVDLEDARRVRHRDLDPHGLVAAGRDRDVLDRVGRQRVDVGMAGLERDARAALGHVERVRYADDRALDRERLAL